jgi:hypothetical protein
MPIPPLAEGRIAIVTTREVGCDGRDMSQRVLHMRTKGMTRTVKSCGPGLPVLRSSLAKVISRGDGGNKAGPRGELV